MNYINISKLYVLFPLILCAESFNPPIGGYTTHTKVVERNISLEEINKEVSMHVSNNTQTHEDIVKLRNRLNEYLDASNIHVYPYIKNSAILISSNTTMNTSEITNRLEKVNSNINNSNTGVILEQDMHTSIIENEVSVENSNINNLNMGIEIKRNDESKVKEEELNSLNKENSIINNFNSTNSEITGTNHNSGISIGR